jgi:5,10-methenyltetrahydrofolate synthetase
MPLSKVELRAQFKQLRLEMLDEEHRLASQAIVERLKTAADWSKVKSIHFFVPIEELAEVDINEFIRFLEDTYPNLQMATSRQIEDKWEIVGVHGGEPPKQFDTVIVPMLGFDPKTLHRIGYGGGYYDKFLAGQKQARKIGVCFEQGKIEGLKAEEYDVSLDMIITDRGVVGQH